MAQEVEASLKSAAAAGLQLAAETSGNVAANSGQGYAEPSGSAELWHAVHVGDEAAIQRFVAAGQCDGTLRDLSGHSVLWHIPPSYGLD